MSCGNVQQQAVCMCSALLSLHAGIVDMFFSHLLLATVQSLPTKPAHIAKYGTIVLYASQGL